LQARHRVAPYRHHFFVAEGPAIRYLGLDPEDPDWERIGWTGCARSMTKPSRG